MAVTPKDGRFVADVRDRDGKRFRPRFDTQAAAERWEKQAKLAIKEGRPVPDKEEAIIALGLNDFYLKYRLLIWGQDKVNRTNKSAAASCMQYLGETTKITAVDTLMVEEAKAEMMEDGLTSSTINSRLSWLSMMLKYANKRELIEKMPIIERCKLSESQPRFLTKDQENKIRDWFLFRGLEDDWMYLQFLLYTGARFSEPKSLKPPDVAQNNKAVTFTKTKNRKARTVPLTAQAKESLEYFLRKRSNRYIFETVKYRTVKQHWDIMRDNLGHGSDRAFTIHILRHTCASRLVQAGVDLRRVQEWMGHKSIKTTLIYANLAANDLDVAAKALEDF